MYKQVLIDASQRSLQRILWRETPQQELKTYELATVTYGTSSALFLATRSLNETAYQGAIQYPLGAEIVLRDFYVDDMLTGASTFEEALEIKRQTLALLQTGGFELRKWFSNDSRLRDNNSNSNKAIDTSAEQCKTRTLEISWNCDRDSFYLCNCE